MFKNQLYLYNPEIHDEDYKISEEDKKVSRKFFYLKKKRPFLRGVKPLILSIALLLNIKINYRDFISNEKYILEKFIVNKIGFNLYFMLLLIFLKKQPTKS